MKYILGLIEKGYIMIFLWPLKSVKLPYSTLIIFFLGCALIDSTKANDSDMKENLGNLSARIEELENQINGQGGETDDRNPGSRVTLEDLESLRDEIRALRDSRQTPREDINHLQEEIQNLHEDVKQLQKENTSLRSQKTPKKNVSVNSDSFNSKPIVKNIEDDETDSILKLLEQSAPENEEESTETRPRKKQNDKKNLESLRETATKEAEKAAPHLPAGDTQAQYNQAFALYDSHAYKEAERAFDSFLKAHPNDPLGPKAMYWKAECCLKQNKYKEAKILFVNAYKKNPKGPKAPHCLLKLGEALAIQGKKDDACTAWLKLKTDFPHMTDEMRDTLITLKKKYGCEKNSAIASKSTPES